MDTVPQENRAFQMGKLRGFLGGDRQKQALKIGETEGRTLQAKGHTLSEIQFKTIKEILPARTFID